MLAPRRYGQDDFAESILLARLNSARAGVAAADTALAKLDLLPARVSLVEAGAADYGRASVIARNYTAWFEEKTPLFADMTAKEAAALVQNRVDRIAATESSRAFNEGLRGEARRVGSDRGIALYRTWSALSDSCPACQENQGARVGINDSYPSGEEPGQVHTNCRCTEDYST